MKNTFTKFTSKLFLMGAVGIIFMASCKKIEVATPLEKPATSNGVLPPPAVKYNATLTVTPTGNNTGTQTEVFDPSCECYVPAGGGTETPPNNNTETETPPTNTETASSCPAAVYPIWAGAGRNDTTKATKVGSVSYTNDGVNLYVTATYTGPTCPTEIHLWAGSSPLAVSGNGGLPFGKFPYKLSPAGCGTHTFTIPLSTLFASGTTDFCNKNVYIVLHAAMDTGGAETTTGGQTAMAYGSKTLDGSRWGWMATYSICCPN